MTRELKLALIVGFFLVMVVTVLLSDHYSKSRQSELAADMPAKPTLVPNLASEPDDGESAEVLLASNRVGGMGPDAPLVGPVVPNETQYPPIRTADQTTAGEQSPGTGFPPGAQSAESAPFTLVQGTSRDEQNRLLKETVDRAMERLAGRGGARPEAIGRETVDSGPGGRVGGGTLVAERPIETALSRETLVPSNADRIHVVASGETLTKVARRYYNDGAMWKQLAAYNAGIAGKDGQVRVGAKLKIPAMDVLAGKSAAPRLPVREPKPVVVTKSNRRPGERPETKVLPDDVVTPKESKVKDSKVAIGLKNPPKPAVGKPAPGRSPAKAPTKAPTTYTVRAGDTLRDIAREQLGSVARADEIIQLNRKVITDPNNVPEGAVLTLPRA